jgi:hypothetical protein
MADEAGGDVQQPVAQRLGLGDGEGAVEQQRLGPAGEVWGGQDQLQPDGVAAQQVEGEVAQPGGLGGADAVLDPSALAVPQLQPGDVGIGLVGEEDLEAVPVVVAEAQLGAGVGVLSSADRPVPAGQVCRSIQPVSSQTSALGRTWPEGSIAGVQAGSGWARIASRTWASIGMPSVKATSRSRRCQASRVLAPALSLRTRTGWSPADLGSWARARSTRAIRSSAAPGAALPGRRRPARGSPGAWPRSR